jgi:hypothetical protein
MNGLMLSHASKLDKNNIFSLKEQTIIKLISMISNRTMYHVS